MDETFEKLLSAVYELEGLLLVLEKHGDDTSQAVFNAIKEKGAMVDELSQLLKPTENVEATVVTEEEPVVEEPVTEENSIVETEEEPVEEPDEVKEEPTPTPPPTPQPPVFCPENIAEPGESMRMDEKLQRGLAKNMRQAFSLNDSIRFRRELFENSAAQYNDALDMVDAMKSYDEATEYFFNDLGFDPENEVVNDFMSVVKKHFL